MRSVETNLLVRDRAREQVLLPRLVTTLRQMPLTHACRVQGRAQQFLRCPPEQGNCVFMNSSMEVEVRFPPSAAGADAHTPGPRKAYNLSVRNLCYAPDERSTLLRVLHSVRARCLSLVPCLSNRARPPSISPTSVHTNQIYEMERQEDIDAEGGSVQLEGTASPADRSPSNSRSGRSGSSRRTILKNVSFDALSGEVTAIAGPSGAGKSTLLSLMAGQLQAPAPAGSWPQPHSLLVNGAPVSATQMRRIAGYVTQDDDALFPFLTVHETLLYSARLRLPAAVPWPDKLAKVDAVMEELRLTGVAHSLIGHSSDVLLSQARQISGGERRLTSIGVQSVHDPSILFLDEPTSGLDSSAALQVVAMLQAAAASKCRTIVLSVHQPSALMLRHFSKILLLADGQVAHDGSLDELAARLQAAGRCIPPEMSALEYAVHSQGIVLGPCVDRVVKTASATRWHSQPSGTASPRHPPAQYCAAHLEYANGWPLETCILASRFYRTTFRGRSVASTILLQVLVTSLGLGLLFAHTGQRLGERGIHQRNGFLAYSLTFLLTSAATQGLPIFLQDRIILTREASRGAYRVSSYVLSSCVVFVAFLLPVAVVFAVPSYFMLGLSVDSGSFLFFLLVIWMCLTTANSLSSLVTALIPRYIQGYSLTQSLIGLFFLFSGYFIAKHDIPKYLVFLSYLSLFKFPLEALLINEFSALKDRCFIWSLLSASEATTPTTLQSPTLGPHSNSMTANNLYCRLTGEDVLREAGLSGQSKWVNLMVMAGFAVSYRILCTFILRASILYS